MKHRNYMSMNNPSGGYQPDATVSTSKDQSVVKKKDNSTRHHEDSINCVQEIPENDNNPDLQHIEQTLLSLHKAAGIDGKQAWTVMIALLFPIIFTGLYAMWGVMQDYYIRNQTFHEQNLVMRLTFVGTLFYVFMSVSVFIANIVYSVFGRIITHVLGIILFASGLVLASFVTAIWQLYITVGFMCGTGTAFILTISYRLIPKWFIKYRSTATGLQVSTVSLSGVYFPLIANKLNVTLGAQWTYRVSALIFFVVVAITYPIIKEPSNDDVNYEEEEEEEERYIPSSKKKLIKNDKEDSWQLVRNMLDVSVLKNFNFILWCIINLIYLYSSVIVAIFIPSSATAIGLSDVQGALGSTLLFTASAIGAITTGILADKIGNLNTSVLCLTTAALSALVIWTLAHNLVTFILFVLTQGTSALILIVGIDRYPAALGFRTLAGVASVMGPFFAIYIDSLNTNMEPYFYCKIFAGSGFALCALLVLLIKFRITPKPMAKI
ncbi:major facilitator superfamily domain-containing protein [Phascolomyces articulosus]|uniref:Major facilitator superfamily domain-containing protein n=1 Tax=Phascolomyces articulosus TaxID=60185 RepID=A0AAD5KKG0_9FUNG|nr:major facilitator superfamily domain-containing protein [Phascolomyces articulosus]